MLTHTIVYIYRSINHNTDNNSNKKTNTAHLTVLQQEWHHQLTLLVLLSSNIEDLELSSYLFRFFLFIFFLSHSCFICLAFTWTSGPFCFSAFFFSFFSPYLLFLFPLFSKAKLSDRAIFFSGLCLHQTNLRLFLTFNLFFLLSLSSFCDL